MHGLVGAPMGGFLSAYYAILCFAFIEHRCVEPMFIRLGRPGGIKRYLDDILVALAYRTALEKVQCEALVQGHRYQGGNAVITG